MSIGIKIREKRKENNMTLEDVANRIGVSRQTMSRYETGIIGNIPSDKIEALSQVLRTSPAYLMGWDSPLDITEPYYADAETDALAEALHKTPGMRILFDASRDLNTDDLEFLATMAKKIKGEPDE